MLMYGRGTASVAEQIHSTVEEAQEITDKFFNSYPKIKTYTEQVQEQAKVRGYTETAWGRRRYLVHIQDEPYTFRFNENRKVDFNPLFTAKTVLTKEVPQETKDKYTEQLEKAKSRYQQNKIIDKAREDGIDILSNSKYIAEAKRQCLNSTIQGSAADITKRAMIALAKNEELKQLGFKQLFPVHDEVIAECPFENRKRCAELMTQIMIDSAKEKISVPMKCDCEAFFFWYGPDVSLEDTEITQKQYDDYVNTGVYKSEEEYQ